MAEEEEKHGKEGRDRKKEEEWEKEVVGEKVKREGVMGEKVDERTRKTRRTRRRKRRRRGKRSRMEEEGVVKN